MARMPTRRAVGRAAHTDTMNASSVPTSGHGPESAPHFAPPESVRYGFPLESWGCSTPLGGIENPGFTGVFSWSKTILGVILGSFLTRIWQQIRSMTASVQRGMAWAGQPQRGIGEHFLFNLLDKTAR